MNLEELMALRAEKLDDMKKISAKTDFNQADYDGAKKEFDSLSAQIEAKRIEENLKAQTDDIIAPAGPQAGKDTLAINALMSYARTGVVDAQNATTIGGTSNGAVLIPETYATSILNDLEKNVAMRKFATVIKTNGTYNMPIGGATPTFSWVDEKGTYPTPDVSFTNKSLEAFKAGGIILVGEELLNDESFGLEAHLREKIVEGISIAEGTAFIDGDGNKKPKGIAKDITINETVTATDTISLTDVEDLFLAVPSSARKSGSWIISDKFFKAVFRMKDSTGNYIMREGANGELGTIFNRPFEIDDTMEAGADEPLAIFGKLKDYCVGDRGEIAIQRLDEKYADEGMIGFKVYKRTDGKLATTKNVAQLKNV